jgi:hypothetical protein
MKLLSIEPLAGVAPLLCPELQLIILRIVLSVLPTDKLAWLRKSNPTLRFIISCQEAGISPRPVLLLSIPDIREFSQKTTDFERVLCRHGQVQSFPRSGHITFGDYQHLTLILPPSFHPGWRQDMATIASTMTLVELRLDITQDDAFALSIAGWSCLRTLRKLHLYYKGVSIFVVRWSVVVYLAIL